MKQFNILVTSLVALMLFSCNNQPAIKAPVGHMSAGHGGASGRFERYRITALEYAFILDLAGIKQ